MHALVQGQANMFLEQNREFSDKVTYREKYNR